MTRTRKKAAAKPVRTRLEVDERKAQLLALGERIFSEHPYAAVSIDDVAKEAGISKGLLYHYFPNKQVFFVETMRGAARALLEKTRASSGSTPLERLKDAMDGYFDFLDTHGKTYSALLRSGMGLDPSITQLVEETRSRFLRRLLVDFGMDKPPPRMRAAICGWIGFVEATALDWVDHRDVDKTILRDMLAEVLMHALRFAMVGPSPGAF